MTIKQMFLPFTAMAVVLAASSFAAQAQVDPDCTGGNPGTVTCPGPGDTPTGPAIYADGIVHTATAGDLTVNVGNGVTSFGSGGFATTATGAHSLTLTKGSGSMLTNANGTSAAAILHAQTEAGDIRITTAGGLSGQANFVQYGIHAESTGGGDIHIDASAAVSTATTAAAAGIAGIRAATAGGDIDLFLSGVTGKQYGLYAATEGEGNLILRGRTSQGSTSVSLPTIGTGNAGNTAGIAGLYARTGSGDLHISEVRVQSGSGVGLLIDAGGDVWFSGSASGATYGIDVVDAAVGTTTTLNLLSSTTGDLAAVRAQGEGAVIVNLAVRDNPLAFDFHNFTNLAFDFTGLSQRASVNIVNQAIWRPTATMTLVPDGNFDVTIGPMGGFGIGPGGGALAGPHVVQFQGPDRALTNEGYIAIDPLGNYPLEARVEGLARFTHRGRILLGSFSDGPNLTGTPSVRIGSAVGLGGGGGGILINRTDGDIDDVLVMPGVHWIGEGGEIWMDVKLGSSQASCDRLGANGPLQAADCLRLPGATTEGVTYLTLVDPDLFGRGRLTPAAREGIVLVDVADGQSAQGHFVIGPPGSRGYSPLFGGSLDRGLFQFAMAYREDTQQHVLVGMVNDSAYQQAQLASAVQDLWRLSAGNALGRQSQMRTAADRPRDVWLRIARQSVERDATKSELSGGQQFDFDTSSRRNDMTMTVGLDVLAGEGDGSRWAAGLMLGYVNGDQSYEVGANRAEFNGWNYGVYWGWSGGALWLDGAFNVVEMVNRQYIPGLLLLPRDTLVSNNVSASGFQLNGGWRMALSPALVVEPLAGLSYVITDFEDLDIVPDDAARPGLQVRWKEPTSFRGSLGARLGWTQDFGVLRTEWTAMARLWSEFDGESSTQIFNAAFPDDALIPVPDKLDGTFTEYALGVNLSTLGGGMSAYVNVGGTQSSDVKAMSAAAGVRYHW